ncbi:hypothetical protein ACEN85_03195, partial [Curtobacterium sp. CT11-45]
LLIPPPRDRLAQRYATWQADEATGAEPIPISKLVGVQFGAILACASHVAGPTRASRPSLATAVPGGA